jgi:TRAP-type C4-dicarboxylate transport system permease small subunit
MAFGSVSDWGRGRGRVRMGMGVVGLGEIWLYRLLPIFISGILSCFATDLWRLMRRGGKALGMAYTENET